ncbi:hypothetical protein MOW08_17010 (plasmid) [Acinetobacter schindleri]|uniref:hypothetical protein n=1 Tax=Acinetobacter lwoffii TaxID=28090 RepID=UPI0001BBAECC|nr:hypothetical protein [Acinetobacter lwoffii]EEY88496.1 hypothetical protein HMPREF0017_02906 [Acinetobacter lwoffii SH145]UOH76693.1 hypothetical protein MOW08_17010 [Acinetobacter schindleri]
MHVQASDPQLSSPFKKVYRCDALYSGVSQRLVAPGTAKIMGYRSVADLQDLFHLNQI